MRTLIVINDAPYGTESACNALRLAQALLKSDHDAELTVFLIADAVAAARRGQTTPEGYYNLDRMLRRVLAGKGQVLFCGSCMDERAIAEADVVEGATRSTMDALAAATIAADKVLVF